MCFHQVEENISKEQTYQDQTPINMMRLEIIKDNTKYDRSFFRKKDWGGLLNDFVLVSIV
jgi:hypothetical protein